MTHICYICKKCKSHNWNYLNAIECCQDLSDEEIEKKKIYWKGKFCEHCCKKIGLELMKNEQ